MGVQVPPRAPFRPFRGLRTVLALFFLFFVLIFSGSLVAFGFAFVFRFCGTWPRKGLNGLPPFSEVGRRLRLCLCVRHPEAKPKDLVVNVGAEFDTNEIIAGLSRFRSKVFAHNRHLLKTLTELSPQRSFK